MNTHLQDILDILEQIESIPEEQKAAIIKSLKQADKELIITAFKLDRTEKVKRTTAILLEETIEELEQKRQAVEESNEALQKSLKDLEDAQDQLIQQEKLASLGQLTAGIAHEIKNPLNFVNNFSELSLELVEEIREEIRQRTEDGGPGRSPLEGSAEAERRRGVSVEAQDTSLILDILDDIEANLKTIHKHGSRADSIVKSMLQHSSGGSGKMEPNDLNNLAREFVNLSFHGMRAGEEPINVDLKYDLDASIGNVPLIAEDFSRVIVNLTNNAFDAMREKLSETSNVKGKKSPLERSRGVSAVEDYHPQLMVRTKRTDGSVTIEIEDNGPGIPDEIKNKILQPFFTTKKGTQGTGLGLSITNDIIKAHGGSMGIKSSPGKGTTFTIHLEKGIENES